MRIFTFYSFKGGVGRSNLLYNVAYLLAAKYRARVVVSDWDLHAPGMTCLYDMQDPDGPLLRRGMIDVLSDLADETKVDADEIVDPMHLVHPTRIGRRIQEANPDAGDIWFLPAGAFADDDMGHYRDKVQALRAGMPALAKRGHAELLPWVAERVEARFAEEKKKPDYLLLDARTGLTEIGDLLISRVTSRVIVVFGLNDQNIEGMGHTLRWIMNDVGPDNLASQVLLVTSPVPNGEELVKQQRRQRIDEAVTAILGKASEGRSVKPEKPQRLEIPYHPLIALTERPLAEVYPESEPVKAFEAVTNVLRDRPLETEAVQQNIQMRVREEQVVLSPVDAKGKTPELARKSSGNDIHPLARPMPWNVVDPKAVPSQLLRSELREGEAFLNGLANTLSLSLGEQVQILEQVPRRTLPQIQGFLHIVGEERSQLMALDKSHWRALASTRAKQWVSWVLESARRLGVPSSVAGQRLIDWLTNGAEESTSLSLMIAVAGALAEKQEEAGDAARALLERIVKAYSVDGELLAETAKYAVVLGDLERGYEWFQRAMEQSSSPADVAFTWAWALHERADRISIAVPEQALGLYQEAEGNYRHAVEIKPDKHEAEYNWGVALAARARLLKDREAEHALGLWEEAAGHYRRAVEIKPDKHEAENNWGIALAARARLLTDRDPNKAFVLWEEAAGHYRRALEIKPDDHDAENNWGIALGERASLLKDRDPEKALGLWEEAAGHYRRALEIKPDKHEAEYNWGIAVAARAKLLREREPEKALGLWEEAAGHYRRALEIKPDKHEAIDGLVATLLWQNHMLRARARSADATRAVREALSIAERHSQTIGKPTYNLACVLAQNGELGRALDTLESLAGQGQLDDVKWLREDPDLAPLHAEPRFETLLKTLENR